MPAQKNTDFNKKSRDSDNGKEFDGPLFQLPKDCEVEEVSTDSKNDCQTAPVTASVSDQSSDVSNVSSVQCCHPPSSWSLLVCLGCLAVLQELYTSK
jgi:hypothetical protein